MLARATLVMLAVLTQVGSAGGPREDDWGTAEKSILRLPPAVFTHLPDGIREWLVREGYTIPQTFFYAMNGPHNVVSGAFEQKGRRDWAILASRGDSSAILVFFSGSVRDPIQLEWARDRNFLQTYRPDSIGYSRAIYVADSAKICNYLARYGKESPIAVTHDGIEDCYLEKASSILYYDEGRWWPMEGAD
jgi:hypothetical protein